MTATVNKDISLEKKFYRVKSIIYVPVLIGAMALMFARVLLAAKLLSVSEFGKFSTGVLLANSFCMLSCFGFYLLLQRDLPILLAKGKRWRGMIIMNQALFLAIACFLVLFPLCFSGLFSVAPDFFLISLLNGFAQQTFLVTTLFSRSQGLSMRFATDNLTRAFYIILSIGLCAWITKAASWVLMAETLVTLLMSLWIYMRIHRNGFLKFKMFSLWQISISSMRNTRWSTPLTLLAVSMIGFVMLNGDRWLAAEMLNHEDFAVYAFGGIVLVLAQSLQSVISVSVFPYLAKIYCIEGKKPAGQKAIKLSIGVLTLFLLLSSLAGFPVHIAIEAYFPKYVQVLEFIGLFFIIAALRISDFFTGYLILDGRERQLLKVNIFAVGISVILWWGYIQLSMSTVNLSLIIWLAFAVSSINFVGSLFLAIHFLK